MFTKSSLRPVLLGIVGVAALTACATPQSSQPPLYLKNPIQIAESVERLELYSRPDGMSLSARDQDAVAGFLDGYARFGEGPLYMNLPANGHSGVSQTQNMIETMMSQMGIGTQNVQQGQYQAQSDVMNPVVISYRRLKTLPQDCSINSHLHYTYNNQTYPNFGCSQNANLAAMIQDPRQLLAPYDFAPPDMRRRMEVYDKYIKGDNPASEQPQRQEISSSEE